MPGSSPTSTKTTHRTDVVKSIQYLSPELAVGGRLLDDDRRPQARRFGLALPRRATPIS